MELLGRHGDLAAVDLALKARAAGLRLVWTPEATFVDPDPHWPSAALTGPPDQVRRLRERWGEALTDDPLYNPNLDRRVADFGLAFPPAVTPAWRRTF